MRYWHLAVGLFFLGWIFMYADRTILSPVLGDIESEFGLSGAQLGLINSVFFLTYALMQIPSGALADRIGKKVVLVPGFLLFAIGTALTGLVGKFGWLLGARALTGMGEGTYYSTQYALSSEAIPERRRSLGSAVINSGMAFGISLGFIGSSFVATDLGWRASFLIFSIPTALVAIAIWLLVRDRTGMAEEREESSEGGASIKELLTDRTLLMIYATIFCSLYGFFVILTWLPYFLQEVWGLEGSRVGFIASLVPFAAIPGALFFSSFSDRLSRRKPLALVLLSARGGLHSTHRLQSAELPAPGGDPHRLWPRRKARPRPRARSLDRRSRPAPFLRHGIRHLQLRRDGLLDNRPIRHRMARRPHRQPLGRFLPRRSPAASGHGLDVPRPRTENPRHGPETQDRPGADVIGYPFGVDPSGEEERCGFHRRSGRN